MRKKIYSRRMSGGVNVKKAGYKIEKMTDYWFEEGM